MPALVEPLEASERPTTRQRPSRPRREAADPSADEQTTVQLTVRIRPSVERRLARCLHQLSEAGIRRPSRAELVEAYLAQLPDSAGSDLEHLADHVRAFRMKAPRP